MPGTQLDSDLSEQLSDVEIPSAEDVPTRLGDLWANNTVILVHLRHFGCILCRHFAVRLNTAYPKIRDAGVELVAVGTGGRAYAREFKRDRGIEYSVLVDKHMVSHDIVGTKSGPPPPGILKPAVVAAAARAVMAGQIQGKTGPHPWVFGASHVIGRGGDVKFAWVNSNYHDNPRVEVLLAAAGV